MLLSKNAYFFFSFLGHFIDECEKVVSPKLKLAEEIAKTSQANFEEALSKVSDLEKVWKEVKIKLLKVLSICGIYSGVNNFWFEP